MRTTDWISGVGVITAVITAISSIASGTGLPDFTNARAALVVHVGTTDGKLELTLASGGGRLVHGLAANGDSARAARKAIAAAGMYGLASVEVHGDQAKLPYADNMVNLLISETALERTELLRVLAPNGRAYLRRGGKWTIIKKPRPAAMDEWTHFDHGPDGNALSSDTLVAPPKQVQWISGIQEMKLGGNPAGFSGSSGIRLAGGRVFSDWTTGGRIKQRYGAWDAFNGLPLWSVETPYKGRRRRLQIVADGERLYMFTSAGGPLIARDAANGKIVETYAAAGVLPKNTGLAYLRVCAGKLIVTNGDTLSVLESQGGKVVWKYRDPGGRFIMFPSVEVKTNRLFVAVSSQNADAKVQHRWPNTQTAVILCFDFKSGKINWRSTAISGKHVGQLIGRGEHLGVFAGGGIGAGKNPFIANMRAADGKLLWTGTFKTEWNRAGYSMIWRDGVMYYADPWKIFRLDPKTGVETHVYGGSYNGRCMRFVATDKYMIYSFATFVDRQFNGQVFNVARSACANSIFPGNGMLYFTPTTCRCMTMLRGHLSLTPEPLWESVDDAKRLETFSPRSTPTQPRADSPKDGLIVEHWTKNARTPNSTTEPLVCDGKTFVAMTHAHRMECRSSDGKLMWAFTADGRISSPPVVCRGLCIFGSHDGWVYAVRVNDGTLAWRFLAAPARRKIVACGQLESSWPVYGVVMHQGKVCASAGRHPEIGGGICVYGLHADSGQIAWKRILAKAPARINRTERTSGRIVPNSTLNDVLRSDEKLLYLPGHRGAPFAFDPKMTNEQLARKLNTPPPKKRR
jgi:outer membrane protein assembly factor BamB